MEIKISDFFPMLKRNEARVKPKIIVINTAEKIYLTLLTVQISDTDNRSLFVWEE